ncbi:hypothetical protein C8R43DRAFT_1132230 [Mycena crocata]|nr:hypothetical protein C8R43DRAFT_1132230 [Mycena crocata]
MPEASVQTEASTQTDVSIRTDVDRDSLERKFKQEVLDYVEGRGALPSSEVLLWLGYNNVPADKRPRDTKLFETAVMEQVRKERSEYLARLREGWVERNEGKPWLQFYPLKKPLQCAYTFDSSSIASIAPQ